MHCTENINILLLEQSALVTDCSITVYFLCDIQFNKQGIIDRLNSFQNFPKISPMIFFLILVLTYYSHCSVSAVKQFEYSTVFEHSVRV